MSDVGPRNAEAHDQDVTEVGMSRLDTFTCEAACLKTDEGGPAGQVGAARTDREEDRRQQHAQDGRVEHGLEHGSVNESR